MGKKQEYKQLYEEFIEQYQKEDKSIIDRVIGYYLISITLEECKPIVIEVKCREDNYFTVGKDRGGRIHIYQGKLPIYYKRVRLK